MIKIIYNIFKKFFMHKCLHVAVNQYKDTHYCPDCGKKIKLSWYTIRCGNCKSLRMPKLNSLGQIRPLQKFCPVCGVKEWYSNKSNVLDISESFYAITNKEILNDNIVESDTSVWVEKEEVNNKFKPGNNVIKGKKRA